MNAPDHLVAEAAHRLFAQHAPASAGVESETPSAAFWDDLAETGLDKVLAGGGDTGFHDTVSVLRAAGYHAVAAPIAEMVLAQWLAAIAGWDEEREFATVFLDGRPAPAGGRGVCGPFERTAWGRNAGVLYAIAELPEGARIVRIDTAGAAITEGRNLAGEPRDRIAFGTPPAFRHSTMKIDAQEVYAVAALLRAAQMAGAMEHALELAIGHANTRVQFGRAIGKFQAVQQMLAQLAGHAAAAAAAVDLGADGLAAKDGLLEAAAAKSRAGEAAGFAAEIAHQVIGAMGFTLEHSLHRYTRRLWSWRDEYGNESFWNARLGEAAVGAGGSGLWGLIADRPWLSYGDPG